MVGRSVLQYQIIEKLGAGGMGEIYKAQDTRLNRFVALKVLPAGMASDPERRRRFLLEAQAASALNHPNIITIYDIVSDADTQYMVVEYVAGKTLSELIPKEGLRVPQVIQYASQIADALGAAHAAGIIHRDLKPANVMVTNNGLVKLLDFGLAKVVDRTPVEDSAATVTRLRAPMTIEGAIMGTVNYMSPEQAEGKIVDARSDIFSLGAVMYEMLTGRSAFRGSSPISTLSAVLRDNVQPLVELTPDVPPELEQIILRCLMKDPLLRYQSAQELQSALGALKRQSDSGVLYSRSSVGSVQAPPPPGPGQRSSRLLPIGIACLIAVAAAAYWWVSKPKPRLTTAPTPSVVTDGNKPSPVEVLLTNQRILEMVKLGVDPAVIISQIHSSKTNFDTSSAELIRLSKAGVPQAVIEAMGGPPVPAAPPEPPATPPVSAAPVTLGDGLSVHLLLAEDVPADAAAGEAVHFKAAADVRVNDTLVIAKGAPATGVIVDAAKKRILGLGGKMTFRLEQVVAIDGHKVSLRATPSRSRDGVSKRPVEAGGKKSKDVAALAGTRYTGFVDGVSTVSPEK